MVFSLQSASFVIMALRFIRHMNERIISERILERYVSGIAHMMVDPGIIGITFDDITVREK